MHAYENEEGGFARQIVVLCGVHRMIRDSYLQKLSIGEWLIAFPFRVSVLPRDAR